MSKTLSFKEIQRRYSEPTEAQLYIGSRGMLGKLANPMFAVQTKNNIIMTHGVGNIVFRRNSTASYIDIYGRLRYARYDEPRFEANGLLVENQSSTNLIPYSTQFQRWGNVNSTVAVDLLTTIAPDNGATVDELKLGADVNTTSYIELTFPNNSPNALISNTLYTFSVFVRANKYNKIKVESFNKDNTNQSAIFDANTFTSSSISTGLVTSVTVINNNWMRISYTFNSGTGATNPGIRINLIKTSGVTYASGDGILLWGAQLEKLPYMSSYIPTLASPVLRDSDEFFAPFEYNFPKVPNSSFSVIVDFDFIDSTIRYPKVFDIQLGTSKISMGINNILVDKDWWEQNRMVYGTYWANNSGDLEEVDFDYIPNNKELQRFAFVYNKPNNQIYSSLNNTKFSNPINVNSLILLPDELTPYKLEFGSNGFNGHITSVKIYNELLTEAELGNI
jgi:hypothetical protein